MQLDVLPLALVTALLATQLSADVDIYRGFNMVGNPNAGCCGGSDCAPLTDNDVAAVPGGYLIKSKGWFVPNAEAQPGPDMHYHLCIFQKERRCFLTPAPGI